MFIRRTLCIFIFDGRLDRVHNADIRVVILKFTSPDSFSVSHKKPTHPRICFNSDWPDPEEGALCAEASDKDALIRRRGRVLLSVQ